ncbi:glycine dehydrogenase [Alicycliphilus sp. B1]|nr:glycine dehydrogenase [Alicycliphilus sp. B1]
MEALVNFQTMVCDLTAMPIANASMLDEATAAAEAMTLARRSVKAKGNVFIVSGDCHPQTIEVIQTRAAPLGLAVRIVRSAEEWVAAINGDDYFAALNQYPASSGWLADWTQSAEAIHAKNAALILAADLLALTLLKAPGEMAPTSSSVPRSASACPWARAARTRLHGLPRRVQALHARAPRRRERGRARPAGPTASRCRRASSTSAARRPPPNICTAQVLPAVIASMYAVYHGPRA